MINDVVLQQVSVCEREESCKLLDYAHFVQLCGRLSIMYRIMHMHNL